MKTIYTTTLLQWGNNTGFEVPASNLAELGTSKRPPVKVTINGYSYLSTVAVMDGQSLIPFAKEHRDATAIKGGDVITVTLELDTSPRSVALPVDAQNVVDAAGLDETYQSLAPSYQKEYARSINEAKAPETRDRRIAKMVEELKARKAKG